MKTIVLRREDFNNPLHPRFFEELLEQLNFDSRDTADIDEVTIELHKWTAVAE